MKVDTVTINKVGKTASFSVGPGQPLLLLGGPCALESEGLAREVAGEMQAICKRLGINYVFKALF